MPNFNHVVLVGHLTRDVNVKFLASQTAVGESALAVNRRWTGADGQKRDEVGFFDFHVFGKSAQTMSQFLHKGDPVLIDGRLTYQSWKNKDGQTRSKVVVTVEHFQFVGGRRSETSGPPSDDDTPPPPEVPGPAAGNHDSGDDVPF